MADLLSPLVGEKAPRLARRLIDTFGGLGGALGADLEQLAEQEIAEACQILQAARRLTQNAIREQLQGSRVEADDPRLIEYLRSILCCGAEERFHAIFIDRRGHYLRDETVAWGGGGQVLLRARNLFRRAMDLGAHQLLVAHNHPSGDCRPSVQDLEATDHLKTVAACLDVRLIDHLILTRSHAFSIRTGRKL